jgi:hypothetical protein
MIWESSHELMRGKVLVRTLHFTLFFLIVSMLSAVFAHASTHAYSWTKTMGSGSTDAGRAVVVDGSGNIYVTGEFRESVDFDPGVATDNHTSAGGADIYLTRINSDGTYGWTKTMGGISDDWGRSVAVDGSGNVYVTGIFQETADFDPGAGTDNHTSAGERDILLTKINSDGTYSWTKTMGGTDPDYGYSVAVDGSGNIYVTGYFSGTADFDPGVATDNHTAAGDEDIYLTRINSDGSYGWTKTMGGGSDVGRAVAVDGSGNIYVTGEFYGTTDFDPGVATDNHTPAGAWDIFLTRINSDGSYGWTKTMGGTDSEDGYSVAVDGSGNIYVTGYFSGTADFDPGVATDNHTAAGNEDIFLTKINSDGSYGWTRTMGGTAYEHGFSVAVDENGNVYVTGIFGGTVDFDPGVGMDNHISAGYADIFLTKINSDGSYGWTKTMGGTSNDYSDSVAVDGSGNVYVTGIFAGTADFDPGAGTDSHTSAGSYDIFLTKFSFSTSCRDFNGDGHGDILGMNSAGMIWWYDISGDTWHNIAGSLADMVVGDFNGDMISDIAGLNASGQIWWYDVDGAAWHNISGSLTSIVAGDFNGDGNDDIAGLNASGQIWWYDVEGTAWHNISGSLTSIVAGDFNGDGSEDLAGLNASGQIWWYDVDSAAWHGISGTLVSLETGDFNGDGNDDLAGLNASGQIWWYDVDGAAWHGISGTLVSLETGNFNGDGNDDLAGLNVSGKIWWYDVDGAAWYNIPGTLVEIMVDDYDGDWYDDIAGLNASGQIWYTTDLSNWQNIPGNLEELY